MLAYKAIVCTKDGNMIYTVVQHNSTPFLALPCAVSRAEAAARLSAAAASAVKWTFLQVPL